MYIPNDTAYILIEYRCVDNHCIQICECFDQFSKMVESDRCEPQCTGIILAWRWYSARGCFDKPFVECAHNRNVDLFRSETRWLN